MTGPGCCAGLSPVRKAGRAAEWRLGQGRHWGVLHLLVGDDLDARARVRQRLAGAGGTRRIPLDPDDADAAELAVRAVSATPLFGAALPVELDLGEKADGELLEALAGASATILVCVSRRPAASLLRRLGSRAEIHDCAPPTASQQRSHVRSRLGAVRLTAEASRFLEQLSQHDPLRARDVLWQVEVLGAPELSYAQVRRLCGSSSPALEPWVLADALTGGDPGRLAGMVARVEPVAAWSSVGRMLAQLQLVWEGDGDLLPGAGPAGGPALPGRARERLAALLSSLHQPEVLVVAALACWADGDRRIKADPQPPAELLAASVRLAAVFAAHRL